MATERQRLIFISYSRTNRGFALELAKELKASGFRVWFDQLDIPTGARWDDEIEKALTECEIFMVILTPQSIASNNVKDEIGYAIDSNKRILPILLEHANIPFRIRRFQYVDFTDKSNNEGIDAAKQLLRKLMDEPTGPRPASVSTNVPSPQSEVDRSAALQAEANRLARQKAEAIRNAREQEQRERNAQIAYQTPPPAKKAQPQPQKPATLTLRTVIIGIILLLLLCLGAWGVAAIVTDPPTPIVPPPISTTITPTYTPTPTSTPTSTPTEPTHTPLPPGITPPTNTPMPEIPANPVDFVTFYFENINAGNYDLTWDLLSDQFKAEFNPDPDGKESYKDTWNNSSNVVINSVEYTKISNTAAIVIINSNIASTPLNYYLVWEGSRNTWLFELMPKSFDVSCDRAPKTLSPGFSAEVVTASDELLLRSDPTDGSVVERMSPGTIVLVLGGPECKYYPSESVFFWWWMVETPLGNQGWIVEGSDSRDPVFVRPVP